MSVHRLPVTGSTSQVNFEDAVLIADRCFGELGRRTIYLWREYNDSYFGGSLTVTPVLFVPVSPWGHWVGLHRHQQNIYLMPPGTRRSWDFVRGVLLHEMIHQHLAQQGENTAHAGSPWCGEIMRVSRLLGRDIWAGKYMVKKVNGKSVRANQEPASPNDAPMLNQKQISQWPHSIGLVPPDGTSSCE